MYKMGGGFGLPKFLFTLSQFYLPRCRLSADQCWWHGVECWTKPGEGREASPA